jgi:hypothetical protein
MVRATCRNRRATRWRSTADPTPLPMISPTRGLLPSSSFPRRTCTMTSDCNARTPCFTVASNSVDRLIRLRAGSTAKNLTCDQADSARRPLRRRLDTIERPARVRIRKRKPCTRARRRLFGWKVRLPLATAFSSLSLALPSGRSRFAAALVRGSVGGGRAAGRRGPQAHQPRSQPYRRLSGDCLRVLTRVRWVKLGLPQRSHTQPS